MNIEKAIENFKRNNYTVSYFLSSEEAADYIDKEIDNRIVGFGDSATMNSMGLYKKLAKHNTVYDPNQSKNNDEFLKIAKKCMNTEIYLTSVNGASETGQLVNIDGTGNRVAGSLFGHKKVYFIIGTNKIEENLESAIWRARNIAAPKNAKRYKLSTPCAIKGDKCYDCASPDRICNALVIYYKKLNDIKDVEIIFIDEALGF